jgi:hypothetical protein
MKTTEKIENKIKALFAKVRDTASTEAERNSAEAKANELIIKYAIDQSNLTETEQDAIVQDTVWVRGSGGPRISRLRSLAAVVGQAHGCYVYYQSDTLRPTGDGDGTYWTKPNSPVWERWNALVIIGRPGVVAGVKALTEALIIDVTAGASKIKIGPGHDDFIPWDSKAANTKRGRNAFHEGYVLAVRDRLQALNRTRSEDTGGSLLPVLRSDRSAAEAWLRDGNPDMTMRTQRYSAAAGRSSRAAGKAAGNAANLGDRSMPATRPALTA